TTLVIWDDENRLLDRASIEHTGITIETGIREFSGPSDQRLNSLVVSEKNKEVRTNGAVFSVKIGMKPGHPKRRHYEQRFTSRRQDKFPLDQQQRIRQSFHPGADRHAQTVPQDISAKLLWRHRAYGIR